MSFRKPCHMPFHKLIAPFTLTASKPRFTHSHANTPLSESERAYFLSYFIINKSTTIPWSVLLPLFFVRENSLSYGKITDGAAVNKISIPLNLFSCFAVFNKNNIHPNKY